MIKNYGPPGSHPPEVISETTDKQFVSQAEKDYWNLKVPGPKGDQGEPGITPNPAQERVTSFVFYRGPNPPGRPEGGTYASPIPDGALWSDGIPTGSDPLYVSKRLFTSDGQYPQEWEWSIPVLFLSAGINGAPGPGSKLRVIFSTSVTEPTVPPTAAETTGWYTSAISTAIWMSQQVNTTDENGTIMAYGAWDPPVKIKGEPGEKGDTGEAGVSITWLGEATSHPANPEEGDAYRNTVNKKSYVYRDGAWYEMTHDGVDGQSGYSRAVITLYQKNTSDTTPPSDPTGTFTYTFASGALTGGILNGWTTSPPSVDAGEYLWAKQATAISQSATDDILATEFSGAVVTSLIGNDGAPGLNSATVFLYRKNTTPGTPPALFSGTFTYTFSTGALSGGTLNGWTQVPPSLTQGDVLWRCQATATSVNTTDSVPTAEFSTPAVHTIAGQDGQSGISIVWMGESSEAPSPAEVNMVYKDLDDGIVYICTAAGSPGTWAMMVLDGNDGSQGAKGDDGFSVYITYHDADPDGTPPAKPTTILGNNGGWHTDATAAANWMSQKVDDGTTANWSSAIRIVGNNALGSIPIAFAGKVGGTGDMQYFLNQTAGGTANPGELRITCAEFYHPDGTLRTPLDLDNSVNTNYGEGLAGKYYVMWTDQDAKLRWPASEPHIAHRNFVAIISENGVWKLITNDSVKTEFTPLATDCIIAVVEAVATTGGLTTIAPFASGVAGQNNATVVLYQRTASASPPATPAASLGYNFATGLLASATPWSQDLPGYSPSTPYLWYTQALAKSRSNLDTILPGDWKTPALMNGNGADGVRGGLKFFLEEAQVTAVYTTAASVTSWVGSLSDIEARNIARDLMANWSTDGYLRTLDQITVQDQSANKIATRIYTGVAKNNYASVVASDFSSIVTEQIDGSLVVNGTIATDALAAGTVNAVLQIVGSRLRSTDFTVDIDMATKQITLIEEPGVYTQLSPDGLSFVYAGRGYSSVRRIVIGQGTNNVRVPFDPHFRTVPNIQLSPRNFPTYKYQYSSANAYTSDQNVVMDILEQDETGFTPRALLSFANAIGHAWAISGTANATAKYFSTPYSDVSQVHALVKCGYYRLLNDPDPQTPGDESYEWKPATRTGLQWWNGSAYVDIYTPGTPEAGSWVSSPVTGLRQHHFRLYKSTFGAGTEILTASMTRSLAPSIATGTVNFIAIEGGY